MLSRSVDKVSLPVSVTRIQQVQRFKVEVHLYYKAQHTRKIIFMFILFRVEPKCLNLRVVIFSVLYARLLMYATVHDGYIHQIVPMLTNHCGEILKLCCQHCRIRTEIQIKLNQLKLLPIGVAINDEAGEIA